MVVVVLGVVTGEGVEAVVVVATRLRMSGGELG